jgi:hypothetical protein
VVFNISFQPSEKILRLTVGGCASLFVSGEIRRTSPLTGKHLLFTSGVTAL